MEEVRKVILQICDENRCVKCPMSDRGICNAGKILLLFEKYWGN